MLKDADALSRRVRELSVMVIRQGAAAPPDSLRRVVTDYNESRSRFEELAKLARGREERARLDAVEEDLKNVGARMKDIVRAFVLSEARHRQARLAAAPAWLPQPGEELWVIERPPAAPAAEDDRIGPGALLARPDGAKTTVPVPLKHTDVSASIAGTFATVDVTQEYSNPFASKIEAVYVFPLPTDAAVSHFVMQIGDRKIRGIVREREEATRIYHEAREAGHVASLLTQERPNVFTQKVANIEPGKAIGIRITYYHVLPYLDGWHEFTFPMIVGPRFNPPGFYEGIGAAGYGGGQEERQPVVAEYLSKHERTKHEISLKVALEAGVALEEIRCPTHAVTIAREGPSRATATLSPLDAVPNKDFVLRWKVAGKDLKAALVTEEDGKGGGYFALTLYPPATIQDLERRPMEMVFVLDCSGSMDGVPIAKAKAAIEGALGKLSPRDTLQVIRFSNSASALGTRPVPATPRSVAIALQYVRDLDSEGGTMMIEGIRASLGYPHDGERDRVVSFLTDGFIGNEMEIFDAASRLVGPSRVFSFGVGSSPNRHLLEGLARIGHGAVAWVGLDDATGREAVDAFYDRISRPALTGCSLDFGGWNVEGVYPRRLPDLFVGRSVTVVGRFSGAAEGPMRLRGTVHGSAREIPIVATASKHAAVSKVWARTKVGELSLARGLVLQAGAAAEAEGIGTEIRETALAHGIVSDATAFVAVDAARVTEGDTGTTVPVATPLPAGMTYPTGAGGR
ncbi:MAG: VWA domain-containing protein [Planctomycetales bacterium]|nr:VWA domain-containing protein [Planctomycetales bacterium]